MCKHSKYAAILIISSTLSLVAQSRSTAVPIVYLFYDRTGLPIAGLGHFLREDYAYGATYAISEGITYSFWKSTPVNRDTAASPCLAEPGLRFRRGVRGYSPTEFAKLSLTAYSYQAYMNVRFLDAFTTYRNYRATETHPWQIGSQPIADLAASPFRWKYLREPDVYIPLLLTAGLEFTDEPQGPPMLALKSLNWLGLDLSPASATLGATLLESAGFLLLAVAEEGFFRGVIQTELSEHVSPDFGLIASSILFGAGHYPLHGLTYSLRAVAGGLYLGWRYKESHYDLGRPIAIHFYIDFMPILVQILRDPLSARGTYSVSTN